MASLVRFDFVVALSGVAQQLSTVFGEDFRLRQIAFTPRATNLSPGYIGATSGVGATLHSYRFEAPVDSKPHAPIVDDGFEDGAVSLSNYWVNGAVGDYLQIGAMVYL